MHGINYPWKLPSYRFGNLALAYLKDDKTPEGVEDIDNSLLDADKFPTPFEDQMFRAMVKGFGEIFSKSTSSGSAIVDNVIYDSRLTELPIEEQKRREANEKGKPYRVPEWWMGERQAYKVASSMMKILPKKIGPIKP